MTPAAVIGNREVETHLELRRGFSAPPWGSQAELKMSATATAVTLDLGDRATHKQTASEARRRVLQDLAAVIGTLSPPLGQEDESTNAATCHLSRSALDKKMGRASTPGASRGEKHHGGDYPS